ENRGWVKQRIVAIGLAVMIIFALTVGMTILTISSYVYTYFQSLLDITDNFWINLFMVTRWFILAAIYFFTVSILYKFGPSSSNKWKFFSPGATLATILAILTFLGFPCYINHFNAYNRLYGSIGTLIIIMIWLYLNSLILLIGFELNASIKLSKRSIKIVKPRFNSFKRKSQEPQRLKKW